MAVTSIVVPVRYGPWSHEGEVPMHPSQFVVDVDALESIGAKVAEAAGTLRESVKAAGAGLAPPPQAGSAATAAAKAAERAWLADLHRLTEQVDGYGAKLTASAHTYLLSDQANAERLRRSGAAAPR
ncbi:type VII secretion target [Salinispora arenicola]|uniref:type VII secretion target n=1 Tax=Salinispora arenicola TaxID=168697 RepID=UPI00048DE2B2|nr:type VII secretion target [Salinispora arenicola]NIL57578.1 hypothetical protein [Salinispora arenicola]NIL63133.1 hypothetical protein [Salinispora arenicola]